MLLMRSQLAGRLTAGVEGQEVEELDDEERVCCLATDRFSSVFFLILMPVAALLLKLTLNNCREKNRKQDTSKARKSCI